MDIRRSIRIAVATAIGVATMIVGAGVARAESWKSLTPLESTCEDVKRVMGTSDCSSRQEFEFREEKVTIFLADSLPCDERWPAKHWDVPEGTVTAIHVVPKSRRMISEYGIPIDEYKSRPVGAHGCIVVDFIMYWNHERGIVLEASPEGEVQYALYYPTSGESSKACPAFRSRYETRWEKRGCSAWTFETWQGSEIDFDGLRTVAPELARYFEILNQSNPSMGTRAYLVFYEARDATAPVTTRRAARIQHTLVAGGFPADRIVVVDGGFRDKWSIELFFDSNDCDVWPRTAPTVHPCDAKLAAKAPKP